MTTELWMELDDKLSSKNRVLLLGEGWELVFPRRYYTGL